MNKENELKECPFCGSKAYVGKEPMSSYWSVGCTKCFCSLERIFKTKEIAIEKWNKRKQNE